MIRLDGSLGEGGGQILRTALCLSALTCRPFTITRIRAGRKKPGLLRQHLTAVNAAVAVCNAEVSGHQPGSGQLVFRPGRIVPGEYFFDIGSAGSSTLVLQTVLPALLCTGAASRVTVRGGTHNAMAPPFDFLAGVLLPLLGRMGARVAARIYTYGFFPVGGGRIGLEVEPATCLQPLQLAGRPQNYLLKAYAYSARIPERIIRREIAYLRQRLPLQEKNCVCREVDSPGPGNVVLVEVAGEGITELFTGFGAKGVPLERVCDAVIGEVQAYLKHPVAVGPHLADQLLIPLALAGSGRFTTLQPTPHTLTNIKVIRQFLDVPFSCRQVDDAVWEVMVGRG